MERKQVLLSPTSNSNNQNPNAQQPVQGERTASRHRPLNMEGNEGSAAAFGGRVRGTGGSGNQQVASSGQNNYGPTASGTSAANANLFQQQQQAYSGTTASRRQPMNSTAGENGFRVSIGASGNTNDNVSRREGQDRSGNSYAGTMGPISNATGAGLRAMQLPVGTLANIPPAKELAANQAEHQTTASTSFGGAVQKRQSKEETVVFFRGVTWLRDSHGLFDYESRNINKKNLKTQFAGKIVRLTNDIEFVSPNQRLADLPGFKQGDCKALAELKQTPGGGGFFIDHGDHQAEDESIDRLWLVIRSLKSPEGKYDYKIKKFDTIKIGRVRFRVKDYNCDQMHLTPAELYRQELKEAQSVKTAKDFVATDAVQCRFCWGTDEEAENPLILACKCRGSVGLIHFQCLKSWITTQKHVKEYGENVTSYYWKKFECEICKQSYPYIFKHSNKLFKLIDVKEQGVGVNYILLESMPLDKNTSRNIHMLTVTEKKNEFKLGRGHESEVRINDISVSRCHAIIKCKPDGFYVEDNCSKFGTIVLLKDNLKLEEDHTMAVQVGRTVLSFTIKSIDLDKRMREKLKREIRPLLRGHTKEKEKEIRDKEENERDKSGGGAKDGARLGALTGGVSIQPAAVMEAGMTGMPEVSNQIGGSHLNSSNNKRRGTGEGPIPDLITRQLNDNQPSMHRANAGQLPARNFGSRHNQRGQEPSGSRAGSSRENAVVNSVGPNVSRSALVNSGNAAISGHHGINPGIGNFNVAQTNAQNNGASFASGGNSILAAAAYGNSGVSQMTNGERELISGTPNMRELQAQQAYNEGSHHGPGAVRAGAGQSESFKIGGATNVASQGGRRASFQSRANGQPKAPGDSHNNNSNQ